MKILIFTFSGTGNTFATADYIACALKSHDANVKQYKIEEAVHENSSLDFDSVSHILIGYPIYAFNAPQMVIDFIKLFPKATGQKISIFKTAGEPFYLNKCSSSQMKRILSKKGYDIMMETHFLMPYNVMFRYEDALAKQMYLFMQDMAKKFASKVVSGEKDLIPCSAFGKAVSFSIRGILWWGSKFNGRLYSYNKKKCTMCLKCVRECPTKNITVKDDKLCFDGSCAMCMRCVQRCPTQAIDIGILRFWAVKGVYDFKRIANDDNIPSNFVNTHTKGYFRLFRKFFGVK